MSLPADLSDILNHPDIGVRATGLAMVYAARLYGPALRAAVAADAASGIPLLGTHDRWSMVHELSGTDDPASVVLAPCRWRTSRNSHCLCWRCNSQQLEVLVARTIIAPCADKEGGCHWCSNADDESRLAAGIVKTAHTLAAKATKTQPTLRGVQ
jgi:hypothetical protein